MAKDRAQLIKDIDLLSDILEETHRVANDASRGFERLNRLYEEADARNILDQERGVAASLNDLEAELYERH